MPKEVPGERRSEWKVARSKRGKGWGGF